MRRIDYKFKRCITDPSHFINKYVDYAQERTDAAWDYHEAQAIMLLSLATQGVLWKIPSSPGGLSTNLYIINHGRTSDAKKSTVMNIAREIQRGAMPGIDVPENFTPGALEEVLAEKPGCPSMLWADEFNGHLDRMHNQTYMAGMRSFFLSMYGKRNWTYQRVSKGKSKKKDMVEITNAHLCIAGNTTPAITDMLKSKDIDDGFLARFAIVWPQVAPAVKGLRDMSCDDDDKEMLTKWLRSIRDMCIQIAECEDRYPDSYSTITASDEAYDVLDNYQTKLAERNVNRDEQAQSMSQRLPAMSLKLAAIMAAGRHGLQMADHIAVTEEDAKWSVAIARKWEKWAVMFVASMAEDPLRREVQIAESVLKNNGGKASRTKLARKLRMRKYQLDELQLTMVDRGLIQLAEQLPDVKKGRPKLFWIVPGYCDEKESEA